VDHGAIDYLEAGARLQKLPCLWNCWRSEHVKGTDIDMQIFT
jgi:hypothetical protein